MIYVVTSVIRNVFCTDLETEDVDYTVKKSPKANDPLTFGFSEDEEEEEK